MMMYAHLESYICNDIPNFQCLISGKIHSNKASSGMFVLISMYMFQEFQKPMGHLHAHPWQRFPRRNWLMVVCACWQPWASQCKLLVPNLMLGHHELPL